MKKMAERKTAEQLRAEARLRYRAELDNEHIDRLDKIIGEFRRDCNRETMRALAAEIDRLNAFAEVVQSTKSRRPVIVMPVGPFNREPRLPTPATVRDAREASSAT